MANKDCITMVGKLVTYEANSDQLVFLLRSPDKTVFLKPIIANLKLLPKNHKENFRSYLKNHSGKTLFINGDFLQSISTTDVYPTFLCVGTEDVMKEAGFL